MAAIAPRRAADHDDRTTVAVKSVLIETGRILGSCRGRCALVGGAVPWLLPDDSDMCPVGTPDMDRSLGAEASCEGE